MRMHDHIWSYCELRGGGQSSLSVGDVLSNLIHSLCEGIHAVRVPSGTPGKGGCLCSCHDNYSDVAAVSVSPASHENETTVCLVCGVGDENVLDCVILSHSLPICHAA